jgi:YHS domain-containing protein
MLKQLAIVLCLVAFIGAIALAQDKPETPMQQSSTAWNKVDPIDGKPIDAKVATVEFNDKVWGFNSNENAAKFRQDPETYSKNLSEDGAKFIGKKMEGDGQQE